VSGISNRLTIYKVMTGTDDRVTWARTRKAAIALARGGFATKGTPGFVERWEFNTEAYKFPRSFVCAILNGAWIPERITQVDFPGCVPTLTDEVEEAE